MSARSASRSVSFPLPSSPHWAPTITIPGIGKDYDRRSGDALNAVAAAGGPASCVSGLEHLGARPAHEDLADRRLHPLDLDSLELFADELRLELDRVLCGLAVAAGRDRVEPAPAAIDRLVGDETRHLLDPGGEDLVDPAVQLIEVLGVDLVLADARVHDQSNP